MSEDTEVWPETTGAVRPMATDAVTAYNEYADEFALNDIGLALRFSPDDRSNPVP